MNASCFVRVLRLARYAKRGMDAVDGVLLTPDSATQRYSYTMEREISPGVPNAHPFPVSRCRATEDEAAANFADGLFQYCTDWVRAHGRYKSSAESSAQEALRTQIISLLVLKIAD